MADDRARRLTGAFGTIEADEAGGEFSERKETVDWSGIAVGNRGGRVDGQTA